MMRGSMRAWDESAVRALHRAASATRTRRGAAVFFGTYVPFFAALAYAAFLFAEEPARFAAAAFAEAVAAGTIARFAVGSPLRYFFPRSRPHKTHGFSEIIREESLSLPSGHALFFFAFATSAFFASPAAGILLLVCAAVIGAARVAAGIHYPTDIALGALIGVVVAILLHAFMLVA